MGTKEKYIEKYRKLHEGTEKVIRNVDGEDKMTHGPWALPGIQCLKNGIPNDIKKEARLKGRAMSVLDFGCGQGIQLRKAMDDTSESIFDVIGLYVQCWWLYDPAIERYSEPPNTLFDVIVCSEVMEHIPEESVDEVLLEQKQYLKDDGLICLTIAALESFNSFEDGENLHCTIMPVSWWEEKLKNHFDRFILKYFYSDRMGTLSHNV